MKVYTTLGRRLVPFEPRDPGRRVALRVWRHGSSSPPFGPRSGGRRVRRHRAATSTGWASTSPTSATSPMSTTRSLRRQRTRESRSTRSARRSWAAFSEAYQRLGTITPTIEPRATEHIPEMIEHDRPASSSGTTPTRPAEMSTSRCVPCRLRQALGPQHRTICRPGRGSNRGSTSAIRSTSRCGRRRSRVSRAGTRRGDRGVPGGTSSARRWLADTWAMGSTFTAGAAI